MSDQSFQCREYVLQDIIKDLTQHCPELCFNKKACNLEFVQQSREKDKARMMHEN